MKVMLLGHPIDEEHAQQKTPLGDTRYPFYSSRKMAVSGGAVKVKIYATLGTQADPVNFDRGFGCLVGGTRRRTGWRRR